MEQKPDFDRGDLIISITGDHTTAAKGRIFKVESIYHTPRGWRVEVLHPAPRFAGSTYYARKFVRYTGHMRTHDNSFVARLEANQENNSVYIALVSDTKIEHFDKRSLATSKIVAIDTTMDRGFKDAVNRYVQENPEDIVLVFALDKVVEAERTPVLWKNMR